MARSSHIQEFVEELKSLGSDAFRVAHPHPVLAWIGIVGDLSELRPRVKRPTAKMAGNALESDFENKGLVGQVWFVREDPEEPSDRITAGRAAHNDLVIPEYSVSMEHCEIQVRAHRTPNGVERTVSVIDLGSLNGSAVRGERLTPNVPVELRPSDDFALGRLRFVLLTADEFIKRVRIVGRIRGEV